MKEIKAFLNNLNKEELIDFVLRYYKKNKENKELLDIIVFPDNDSTIIDKYKDIIIKMFYPERGESKISFREIRKIIKQYKDISKNKIGLCEIIITAVEYSTKFTCDYGDMDEKYYDSVIKLYQLFLDTAAAINVLTNYEERCKILVEETEGIGWGFHDELSEMYSSYY